MKIIVWFRQDLRCEDNPALTFAAEQGRVIPVYIWSPEEEENWSLGAASRWWLHYSLISLQKEFQVYKIPFLLRKGDTKAVLEDLLKESEASMVVWNRRYEPMIQSRDEKINNWLNKKGIKTKTFNSALLFEPWMISNRQQKPFRVFTPFWKQCLKMEELLVPLFPPSKILKNEKKLFSFPVKDLHLLPKIPWDEGLEKTWIPGTRGAKRKLADFLSGPIVDYKKNRDYPGIVGTSFLSPYLHFGEISPKIIWNAIRKEYRETEVANCFLRQLGWREFAYHLLYHFPNTPQKPLKESFNKFDWEKDEKKLRAWKTGTTGYPIVDAGMRQLWATGWMHNRVRMITGSFLVKDLLINWLEGARWFWDTLVDADLANNTLGWQWVAGCGADAAPYFRILNPITQGEKFDSAGVYVRKWVPEIASLPNEWLHKPWLAPQNILQKAGITLSKTYPLPIVDHELARKEALIRWRKQKPTSR